MNLPEAIDHVNERQHSDVLAECEMFFLTRMKEDLEPEERAEAYYYLLRLRLKKSQFFETLDMRQLYQKMREAFGRAESDYVDQLHGTLDPRERAMTHQALSAFYHITDYHFGSLERLYLQHNFDESHAAAHEDRMHFRRRAAFHDRKWGKYITSGIVNITSRYGGSFVRWGVSTLVAIFVFAFLYFLTDLGNPVEARMVPSLFPFNYLYFSVVTFTTLGYGDVLAHTVGQKIIASGEVMLGYYMLGMFVNLMSKRL